MYKLYSQPENPMQNKEQRKRKGVSFQVWVFGCFCSEIRKVSYFADNVL